MRALAERHAYEVHAVGMREGAPSSGKHLVLADRRHHDQPK